MIVAAMMMLVCGSMAQAQVEEDWIVITAEDTVVNKTAYTIVDQGITISISSCSAYPEGHPYNNIDETYFAVLANGNMTITAADTIKGIAVNGWVRKNFTASSNYGTIDYLSDPYDDVSGEPVLTVSDIDNPTVTISCNNQLRCFSVEIYFSENPGEVEGESADTVRFTAVTAQALDFSDDETFSSDGAYSYWLCLSPSTTYPMVWLDMYSAVQGDLSGDYSTYDFNVGDYSYVQLSADAEDYEYVYDQAFTITSVANGYHIEGWVVDENDVQYEFVYEGPVTFVSGESGVALSGGSVNARKQLRNGVLLIERGGCMYDVMGRKTGYAIPTLR